MPPGKNRYEYRRVEAAQLRAATQPVESALPLWPTPQDSARAGAERWVAWLRLAWADSWVADSVEVASPALASRIEAVVGGAVVDERRARRMALALARYVLRAGSRATPYGMFAGVIPARFATMPDVRFGQQHRGRLRPDARWLDEVISLLEQDPVLLPRLPVVTNILGRVVGDRLRIPASAADGSAPAEVCLRLTRAVTFALATAASPVRFADLAAKLAAEFQGAPPDKTHALLADLVKQRALISVLRAPATVPDPLGYLLDQLNTLGVDTLPQLQALDEIHACMEDAGKAPVFSGPSRTLRAVVAERMRGLAPVIGAPLAVDVRLDGRVVLPEAVAREVEIAAGVLARLAAYPQGSPAWREYAERFAGRYGPGTLVPVAELVDPLAGLGYPNGYSTSAPQPPPVHTPRDENLLALAQRAALDRVTEVPLTDTMIADLQAASNGQQVRWPPHLELNVQVLAESHDALSTGRFIVRVLGVSRAAATMTGRFIPLLEPDDQARMVAAFTHLSTVTAEATTAQLSFAPLRLRADHVVRSPRMLPSIISLGEYPDQAARPIPVDDLAVGCGEDHRLFLASLSRGCAVETLAPTSLNYRTAVHTPPLGRFLAEIARAGVAQVTGFDWGAASVLPFLPALRYGRIVMIPARWRLACTELPGPRAPLPEWIQALHAWRERRYVPSRVLLAEGDQHLLLNLDQDGPAELLRDHLDRTWRATLIEAPEPSDLGWINGRAHSLVVPLISTQPPAPPRHVRASAMIHARSHGSMPATRPRLDTELSVDPEAQTHVLLHIPELMASLVPGALWWFDRINAPEPRLRLHITLPEEAAFGTAAEALGAWANGLRAQGLLRELQLTGYTPHTGRWGSGEALATAERVFHTDSRVVLAQLTTPHSVNAAVLGAANIAALATGFFGTPSRAMHWLAEHARPEPAPPPVTRAVHAESIRLADPADDFAALHTALDTTPAAQQAWRERAQALATYRRTAIQDAGSDLDASLAAILHAHAVRARGVDDVHHRTSLRLARTAALAYLHAEGEA
ncbi:lantibiotic dehydratase [Nonomuraea sp. ZG12]|uniref:lantibiotic dehydratase n=1 Tax=Nonomuraea sp. ZG12 TaxID=3452207 RepID=UPI003F8CA3D5